MKFLVDENLPPRLAAWLSARGHDAVHVRNASLLGANDGAVTTFAKREGRIVVTQDADFDPPPSGLKVLRLGLGNAPAATLLVWLEPRLESAIAQLESGAPLVTLA